MGGWPGRSCSSGTARSSTGSAARSSAPAPQHHPPGGVCARRNGGSGGPGACGAVGLGGQAGHPPHARQGGGSALPEGALLERADPESLNQALAYFGRAVVQDPAYAEASVGLADTYNLLREYTSMPDSEAYPKALAAARNTVHLDDRLADGHRPGVRAVLRQSRHGVRRTRIPPRRSDQPQRCGDAYSWYATCLMSVLRFRESLEQIQLAPETGPLVALHPERRGAGVGISGSTIRR